jgi:hypothetical protein
MVGEQDTSLLPASPEASQAHFAAISRFLEPVTQVCPATNRPPACGFPDLH